MCQTKITTTPSLFGGPNAYGMSSECTSWHKYILIFGTILPISLEIKRAKDNNAYVPIDISRNKTRQTKTKNAAIPPLLSDHHHISCSLTHTIRHLTCISKLQSNRTSDFGARASDGQTDGWTDRTQSNIPLSDCNPDREQKMTFLVLIVVCRILLCLRQITFKTMFTIKYTNFRYFQKML